jgi:hypothetical protein
VTSLVEALLYATQHTQYQYHITTKMSATHQQKTTRTSPDDDESTKQLPARDIQSKDNKSQVLVSATSHHESHQSDSQNKDTAAAVNAIMGPPPPKDEKTGSRWERWRRDRKEAKEMGMPSQESSGRWGVKNFAA